MVVIIALLVAVVVTINSTNDPGPKQNSSKKF